jgi:NAD(P)-dependent dehydrogenase (short-subunit alcohol dehydrogenase family)
MAGRVAGKVALITGAARGQGRAHAVRAAQEGADVIAVDLAGPPPSVAYEGATPADLEETVRQVEKQDRRIVAARCDVRDLDRLRSVVHDAVADLGRLDVVVANAGICARRRGTRSPRPCSTTPWGGGDRGPAGRDSGGDRRK